MANPNGRKGAGFEVAIMKFFRSVGILVERLVKAGKNDEGDLVAMIAGKTYIFELKNWGKPNLPQFWREAQVEAENYAKARGLEQTPPAYIILKRRNAPVDQAWVICSLEAWLKEKNES